MKVSGFWFVRCGPEYIRCAMGGYFWLGALSKTVRGEADRSDQETKASR
jgi:hypothetical protein